MTSELRIDHVGARGDGVAISGKTRIFVPLSAPGDRLLAHLDEDRGEIAQILQPGPDRAAPPCIHFGVCGGCALQHLSDGFVERWKSAQIREALSREGIEAPIRPVWTAPPRSRRRATLAAKKVGKELLLGFNGRRSHRIVDLAVCQVMVPALVAALPALRAGLAQMLAAEEAVDVALLAGETGLDITLTGGKRPDRKRREEMAKLADKLDAARLSWRARAFDEAEPIAARRQPVVRLGGLAVVPPAGGFLQAVAAAEAEMLRLAREWAVEGNLADLFCGAGSFALGFEGRRVLAADGDAAAVAAMRQAARMGGRERLEAVQRDLFRNPLTSAELKGFKTVLFDPPRVGAQAQAAEIAKSGAERVVAVSCNAGSFARDAAILERGGFRLRDVQPIDQFRWSAHVELITRFERK